MRSVTDLSGSLDMIGKLCGVVPPENSSWAVHWLYWGFSTPSMHPSYIDLRLRPLLLGKLMKRFLIWEFRTGFSSVFSHAEWISCLCRCPKHHRHPSLHYPNLGYRYGSSVRLKSFLALHCSHEWSTKLPQYDCWAFENDRLSLPVEKPVVCIIQSIWLVRPSLCQQHDGDHEE